MILSAARLNPRFKSEVYPRLKKGESIESLSDLIDELVQENEEYYQKVNIEDVSQRLNRLDRVLRKHLVNRGEVIRQGMRALMTGEHQFIFSSAGVAKSLYAKQLFSCFKNSDVFSIQFCPDTTADDLFGAYDIEKFKKGEIHHNIEGSIITHPFAFLDEFMDGNDKLLRTLLGVLLERRFIAGSQVEVAMLHSAIATSNYMRRSETTEALLDRFLYKSFISPAKDLFTLLRIDQVYLHNTGNVNDIPEELKIEMRELIALKRLVLGKDDARKVSVPTAVHFVKNMIASSFEYEMIKYRQDYYLSPRTISKSNDLIKANAILNNRKTANMSDLDGLHYLFCTLNEPLDEHRRMLSQQLFKDVVTSKRQYYRAIEHEMSPLLFCFDVINKVQYQPELIHQPLKAFSIETPPKGLLDSWFSLFTEESSSQSNTLLKNKEAILRKISEAPAQHREVIDFKKDLLEQTQKVFSEHDI
jgi:MoxR-like ATPase